MFDTPNGEFVGFVQGMMKWALVIGLLLYLAYAGLIIRQIDLLKKSFETGSEVFLRKLAFVHLWLVLVLLVIVLVVL